MWPFIASREEVLIGRRDGRPGRVWSVPKGTGVPWLWLGSQVEDDWLETVDKASNGMDEDRLVRGETPGHEIRKKWDLGPWWLHRTHQDLNDQRIKLFPTFIVYRNRNFYSRRSGDRRKIQINTYMISFEPLVWMSLLLFLKVGSEKISRFVTSTKQQIRRSEKRCVYTVKEFRVYHSS